MPPSGAHHGMGVRKQDKQEKVFPRKWDNLFDTLLLCAQLNYTSQLLLQLNVTVFWPMVHGEKWHTLLLGLPTKTSFLCNPPLPLFPRVPAKRRGFQTPRGGQNHKTAEPGFLSHYLEKATLRGHPHWTVWWTKSIYLLYKAMRVLEVLMTVISMT